MVTRQQIANVMEHRVGKVINITGSDMLKERCVDQQGEKYMFNTARKWTYLSLVNLLIVSLLGVVLRYKGAFSLPVVDYKNLLHAHSHFAFSSWVTTILFTAFIYIGVPFRRMYHSQFWLNQVAGFGMLISFTIQGYGAVSIAFSTLSVIFTYWFAFTYLKDIRQASFPPLVKPCLKLAVIFLVISSIGPFLLAGAGHSLVYYNNAIYFYLHFQYNGWFTFGVMALFFWAAPRYNIHLAPGPSRVFVTLMGIACIPAYCLSMLWAHPPGWIYTLAGGAGLLQVAALLFLFLSIHRNKHIHPLWILSFVSFTIKIILQALTLIPLLGRFAYSFRPVVIGYLHLVVLAFVTFLILGFLLLNNLLRVTKSGLVIFITGVILNEIILMVQCIRAFFNEGMPTAPYWLLGAGVTMFVGVLFMLISLNSKRAFL